MSWVQFYSNTRLLVSPEANIHTVGTSGSRHTAVPTFKPITQVGIFKTPKIKNKNKKSSDIIASPGVVGARWVVLLGERLSFIVVSKSHVWYLWSWEAKWEKIKRSWRVLVGKRHNNIDGPRGASSGPPPVLFPDTMSPYLPPNLSLRLMLQPCHVQPSYLPLYPPKHGGHGAPHSLRLLGHVAVVDKERDRSCRPCYYF